MIFSWYYVDLTAFEAVIMPTVNVEKNILFPEPSPTFSFLEVTSGVASRLWLDKAMKKKQ